VSRNHCLIKYKEGKFWLEDKEAKFGTLALAQGPIEVAPGTTTGMQIGRTLVMLQAKQVDKQKYEIGSYLQNQADEGQKAKQQFIKAYRDKMQENKN